MHAFSYVIIHDSGFAPNPFGGLLTLATCKPKIRMSARKGDFIVGTGSASTVGNDRLVYAAQISNVITMEQYGELPEYEIKRPSTTGQWWQQHGDNVYFKVDGEWMLRPNRHHCKENMDRDLSGQNVLICKRFCYFGEDAIEIPLQFRDIIKKGPGHKRITDPSLVRSFVDWLNTLPTGRHGNPGMSEEEDLSCPRPRRRIIC